MPVLTQPAPHEIAYIDPPWPRTPFGTAKTPYSTMSWADLHDFDLGAWLARDAVVFVWTTGPTHLKECAVLSTWCERFKLYEAGIAYRWIKTKRVSVPELPPGYSLHGHKSTGFSVRRDGDVVEELCEWRGNHFDDAIDAKLAAWTHWDALLATPDWRSFIEAARSYGIPIGASGPRPRLVKQLGEDVIALTTRKRGRVFPVLTEAQVQWIFSPKPRRGEHSRKPAVVRDKIVELLGDRKRVELFAREVVPGWSAWGDEVPIAS